MVVPWQEEVWCCHDSRIPDLSIYYDYEETFIREYGDPKGLSHEERRKVRTAEKEYACEIANMEKRMGELFCVCGRKGRNYLREVFENKKLWGWWCLMDYESILRIDMLEEQNQSERCLWEDGMSVSQVLSKLRVLRHALRRIEYDVDSSETELVQKNYSRYAVEDICERYVTDRDRVYRRLGMEPQELLTAGKGEKR